MESNELIKALRTEAQYQNDRFSRAMLASELNTAADRIESLQTQLSEYQQELLIYQNTIVPELRTQLAESQEREKAAVEALEKYQEPMPVIQEKWEPTECPRCGQSFRDYEDCNDGYYSRPTSLERCPYCGQKLDWFGSNQHEEE